MVDAVHVSSKSIQDYTSPPELVQFLERRFGVSLVIDLAASMYNSRCPRMISKEADESIPGGMDWANAIRTSSQAEGKINGAGWCNPEFRKADFFMERAKLAAQKGAKIITLTLTSLGTNWYEDHVKPCAHSFILKDRVTFVGQPAPYPKELMVSLFGFGMTGLGWLSWKKEAYETYVPPPLVDIYDYDHALVQRAPASWEPGSGSLIQQGLGPIILPPIDMPEGD